MTFRRRNRLVALVLFSVSVIALQTVFQKSLVSIPVDYSDPCQNAGASKCKKILLWNNAHRIEAASFGLGHEPFVRHQCAVSDCWISSNRSEFPFDQFDAVVISGQDLRSLPSRRDPGQRFVFFSQESPASRSIESSEFRSYFNWTMTYRLDSDIRLLYGRVSPIGPVSFGAEEIRSKIRQSRRGPNYAANKTKSVAWMASHCPTASKRELYVEQLQQHIDVDVYGLCGNLSCRRDERHWLSHPACYDLIERRYKFYLSFENAICNDYVTEKFFNILNRNVLPVVYGGADYELIAPPHSYVDALKYTPEQLARYLHLLDQDDDLYNEYFWWKDHYDVQSGVEQMSRRAFCDLCQKLHQDSGERSAIDDWSAGRQCRTHEIIVKNKKKSDLIRFTLNAFGGFQ